MGKHIGSALGPFVALGDPYDYLPPVGAARTYVPDDNWQEHFKRQCTQCAKILVVPGVSGNLAWELSWIAAWSLRHKLFILTPHHSLKEKGSQYWDMFAAICNNSGIQLGVYPGPGAVVGFRADGVPWVLGRDASTPEAYVALVAMGRPPQARSRRLFVV
jgi:hypothetical protein